MKECNHDERHSHHKRKRKYPETDPNLFLKSAEEYQILMKQGEILLNRLSDPSFAKNIMDQAQKGEDNQVNKLIQTIEGLYVPTKITYSPTGVIFDLQSPAVSKGEACCTLNMVLKWGS